MTTYHNIDIIWERIRATCEKNKYFLRILSLISEVCPSYKVSIFSLFILFISDLFIYLHLLILTFEQLSFHPSFFKTASDLHKHGENIQPHKDTAWSHNEASPPSSGTLRWTRFPDTLSIWTAEPTDGLTSTGSPWHLTAVCWDLLIKGCDTFSSSSLWAEDPDPAAAPGNSCWGRWLSFWSVSAKPVWVAGDGRSWGTLTLKWTTGSFPWCSAPKLSLQNRQHERKKGCDGRISERPQSY